MVATPGPTIAPSAAVPPAMPMKMPSRRTLAIVGGALLIVIVGGVTATRLLAPEAASSESFSRAVNAYFASDKAASERLVCTDNLPYQTNPIRIGEYDQAGRQWMDLLQQSGLYAAPVSASSGGFMPQNQLVYSITDVGRASVRKNKLCVAAGVQATSAAGFDQVNADGGQSRAVAEATLAFEQEAPWLAKSPRRPEILQLLGMSTLVTRLPVELIDKKWRVAADGGHRPQGNSPATAALGQGLGLGLGMGHRATTSSPAPGWFDRVRSLFSFGGHPLVGKWTDPTGMAHFEFTRDSIIENGISAPARFEVKGDTVIVSPDNAGGAGLPFKVRDADHIVLDMGVMSVTLQRAP